MIFKTSLVVLLAAISATSATFNGQHESSVMTSDSSDNVACFDNVNQAAAIANLLFAEFNLAQYPTGCDESQIIIEAFEEHWAEDVQYFQDGQLMFANRDEVVAANSAMAAGLCNSGAYISYFTYDAEIPVDVGSRDTFTWKANVIIQPAIPALAGGLGRVVTVGFRDGDCNHPEITSIDFVPDFPTP